MKKVVNKTPVKEKQASITSIKQTISNLQKEARQQLTLEAESESSKSHLSSEISQLKEFMLNLSQSLIDEMQKNKRDVDTRLNSIEDNISYHIKRWEAYEVEVETMKRSLSLWDIKERDWQKDIEILKVSNAHNTDWMQQIQLSNESSQKDFKLLKNDITIVRDNTVSEALSLRNQWDRQVELLQSKLSAYDKLLEQHSRDLLVQDSQRMDDLEILEQALSTMQAQQIRLRCSVDETLTAARTDTANAISKIDRIETPLIGVKIEVSELRKELMQKEKESRQRFESVAAVLKVFAEALNISPSTFVERTLDT